MIRLNCCRFCHFCANLWNRQNLYICTVELLKAHIQGVLGDASSSCRQKRLPLTLTFYTVNFTRVGLGSHHAPQDPSAPHVIKSCICACALCMKCKLVIWYLDLRPQGCITATEDTSNGHVDIIVHSHKDQRLLWVNPSVYDHSNLFSNNWADPLNPSLSQNTGYYILWLELLAQA